MSLLTVLVALGCLLVGLVIGSQVKFFSNMNKIKKARELQYGELKKIYDLTQNKMKISVEELTSLASWVNTDLPKDITLNILSDPKLTVLKSKGNISDKKYVESFEDVIVTFQHSVSDRLQVALDNINKQLVTDIKGLMNDTIQEK